MYLNTSTFDLGRDKFHQVTLVEQDLKEPDDFAKVRTVSGGGVVAVWLESNPTQIAPIKSLQIYKHNLQRLATADFSQV